MNVLHLTKKLVRIPSFVEYAADSSTTANEAAVAEYIEEFLESIPGIQVERQHVSAGRYNIIASTAGRSRLLLAGHIDTVQPTSAWQKNPFAGQEEDGQLYGLGAVDMKAGVATILCALRDEAIAATQKNSQLTGVTVLFYCDEEYDFLGMKQFVSETVEQGHIYELAVTSEMTQMNVWTAHRGLLELRIAVEGKAGHASRPQEGVNAIRELLRACDVVETDIQNEYTNETLGIPSMNVAAIRGGLYRGKSEDGTVLLGEEGNVIADYAEAVVEVRTTSPELTANVLDQKLQQAAHDRGLKIRSSRIRHNLGALLTDQASIQVLSECVEGVIGSVQYDTGAERGYNDAQMIAEKLGVPVAHIGPRGGNAHGVDEWVEMDSLEPLQHIYQELIQRFQ